MASFHLWMTRTPMGLFISHYKRPQFPLPSHTDTRQCFAFQSSSLKPQIWQKTWAQNKRTKVPRSINFLTRLSFLADFKEFDNFSASITFWILPTYLSTCYRYYKTDRSRCTRPKLRATFKWDDALCPLPTSAFTVRICLTACFGNIFDQLVARYWWQQIKEKEAGILRKKMCVLTISSF